MENQKDNQTEKVVDAIAGALQQVFEEQQNEPFQYAVAYRKVADDTLLGYHSSTFCNLTDDKLKGKRYAGENPYSQLQIISNNVKNVIEKSDEGLFSPIKQKIKAEFFKDLAFEDIYLEADYLDEDTPKQKFVFKKVL